MQALRILIVGVLELAVAPWVPLAWWPVHLWVTVVTLLVGLAVWVRWTGLLGKTSEGRVPLWSYVVLWPWHLVVRVSAWWFRGAQPFTEVAPGWWIGAWPHAQDTERPWRAVLDMTCELPRTGASVAYLCLPTWDVTVPTDEALEQGIAWLRQQRLQGAVLVHCAHGRGRSTLVMLATLVDAGVSEDWQQALTRVRSARPQVRLSGAQQAALERWSGRRRLVGPDPHGPAPGTGSLHGGRATPWNTP